eukprot:TRINITY_DN6102_c0_g1_i10.p3 TRINITY_DN6102_c0_g1~~TRINITY_DN6102_c0_g1_i10.p3  ORF type:complete len:198 (+),score=37.87 TRINITY_DN6102_c0_g1_i10:555-1148(+)
MCLPSGEVCIEVAYCYCALRKQGTIVLVAAAISSCTGSFDNVVMTFIITCPIISNMCLPSGEVCIDAAYCYKALQQQGTPVLVAAAISSCTGSFHIVVITFIAASSISNICLPSGKVCIKVVNRFCAPGIEGTIVLVAAAIVLVAAIVNSAVTIFIVTSSTISNAYLPLGEVCIEVAYCVRRGNKGASLLNEVSVDM